MKIIKSAQESLKVDEDGRHKIIEGEEGIYCRGCNKKFIVLEQ